MAVDPDGLVESYLRDRGARPTGWAMRELLWVLAVAPEAVWLACARSLVLRSDVEAAQAVFDAGRERYPGSVEFDLGSAGLALQAGRHDDAEQILAPMLAANPTHVAGSFLLFRTLQAQGRLQGAAQALLGLFEGRDQDIETAIQAIEYLDGIQRPADALRICEIAIASGTEDARLHAYAGMLNLQLGRFLQVREHYQFVLSHSDHAAEWNVPYGLAGLQRYEDGGHPDFALFRETLERPDLSDAARAGTWFALGKACDDIGDYAQATACLRRANALARPRPAWSRKHWRRMIESRLASAPVDYARPLEASWGPLFIVGVPRSGTTLLAERLARHPEVRHRGELGLIGNLARQLEQLPTDRPHAVELAAARYAAQLRQDDAPARWYLDKQPLNLLHVDLIMALWPGARIIYCERNARDTALSLWSQGFHDPAHGYACDFDDIAAVIGGCRRLMGRWRDRYGDCIRSVRYEQFVADPDASLEALTDWLGLTPGAARAGAPENAIRTASHWQARQPVYGRAVARWRHYVPYVPELLRIPDE